MALKLLIETQALTAQGIHTTGQGAIALDALTEIAAPASQTIWLLAYDSATGLLHKVHLSSFLYASMPDADPEVVGALYTTAGAVMVSTGPA